MQTVSDIDDRNNDFDDDKTMTIFHSAAARHASEFSNSWECFMVSLSFWGRLKLEVKFEVGA